MIEAKKYIQNMFDPDNTPHFKITIKPAICKQQQKKSFKKASFTLCCVKRARLKNSCPCKAKEAKAIEKNTVRNKGESMKNNEEILAVIRIINITVSPKINWANPREVKYFFISILFKGAPITVIGTTIIEV
ncbi:hypothetical protein DRO38_03315 [Candidatus Bathyarchaeota archaeon]|nr:MAG: hypothetical protein DRO38_03315 [Candidatus Bathyarchaeota archaeon]